MPRRELHRRIEIHDLDERVLHAWAVVGDQQAESTVAICCAVASGQRPDLPREGGYAHPTMPLSG